MSDMAFTAMLESLREMDAQQRNRVLRRLLAIKLSAEIKCNREARGWTQRQLGVKCGLKQSYVARLETPHGVARCSLQTLSRIAAAFECVLMVRFCSWGEWISYIVTPAEIVPSFLEEFASGTEPSRAGTHATVVPGNQRSDTKGEKGE